LRTALFGLPGWLVVRDGPHRKRVRIDRIGPHHLVVLVVDDVAVPDLAIAKPRVRRIASAAVERVVSIRRQGGRWQIGGRPAHGDTRHLARVGDDCILPAGFVGIGRRGLALQVYRLAVLAKKADVRIAAQCAAGANAEASEPSSRSAVCAYTAYGAAVSAWRGASVV